MVDYEDYDVVMSETLDTIEILLEDPRNSNLELAIEYIRFLNNNIFDPEMGEKFKWVDIAKHSIRLNDLMFKLIRYLNDPENKTILNIRRKK